MSTNTEFITKFTELLGDDFFLSDMIHQEELFEKQDAIAKLLCEYANEGSSIANQMVNLLPNTFRQEKI
jgi:hypothetical protein|tara:strand:+ start:2199 stop:2405 length:207 start_codon:yes stop_codon:yes gene_type:complete